MDWVQIYYLVYVCIVADAYLLLLVMSCSEEYVQKAKIWYTSTVLWQIFVTACTMLPVAGRIFGWW